MWPQEGFGSVSEERVEGLWRRGGNWAGRESLSISRGSGKGGEGGEMERLGWGCKKCGREYWVRVLVFGEGERGAEGLVWSSHGGWEIV